MYRRMVFGALALFVAWSACAALAGGSVTVYQLGSQDFSGGSDRIFGSQIRAAGQGEAFPFDGSVFGDDRTGRLGTINYTHLLTPPPLTPPPLGADAGATVIRSATLTIGVIDIDSPPGYGSTIGLLFNGISQPAGAFTGISAPGIPSSAEVVTVPVPVGLLQGGTLWVQLQAVRHAPGFPGNSIAVDFSKLTVETGLLAPTPPPEPTGSRGPHSPGTPAGSDGSPDAPGGRPTAIPLPKAWLPGAAGLCAIAASGWLKRRLHSSMLT